MRELQNLESCVPYLPTGGPDEMPHFRILMKLTESLRPWVIYGHSWNQWEQPIWVMWPSSETCSSDLCWRIDSRQMKRAFTSRFRYDLVILSQT